MSARIEAALRSTRFRRAFLDALRAGTRYYESKTDAELQANQAQFEVTASFVFTSFAVLFENLAGPQDTELALALRDYRAATEDKLDDLLCAELAAMGFMVRS